MSSPAAKNLYSTGPLIQANSENGVAISTGYDLEPGEARVGAVRIANASPAAGHLTLTELAAASDFDPGELRLEIADLAAPCVTLIFAGEVDSFPPSGIDLGRFEPGEERTYRFVLACDAEAAGSSLARGAGAAYEWLADGVGGR